MNFPDVIKTTVPAKMSVQVACNPATALNVGYMQLNWFQSPFEIEGAHNQVGFGKTGDWGLFPVYKCSLCNKGLIVPAEVADLDALHVFFRQHMMANHLEDWTK